MYDAIIIGAGIGGLICGCYLAKAGMKVLIAEQHYKPGGYCTSFKRQGFTFDACAHSFGGYRKDGIVRKVFTELGIDKRVKIKRYDPSDIVVTPGYKISFRADLNETIKEFQAAFPDESNNIKSFFYFLNNPTPKFFAFMRKRTFKDLLDQYFTNEKLKAILSFPLLGNGGLPPSLMSAFIGAQIFTEFLIDGGYYPEGGMQVLSDALAERFKELGGTLRLSDPVKKIKVKDDNVIGVVLGKANFISSKYVVSNCDARQTFLNLLGKRILSKDFLTKITTMTPSLSMFILYLGIDKYFDKFSKRRLTMWFLTDYNLDRAYLSAKKGDFSSISRYMIHVSPEQKSIFAFVNAPFKDKKYWNNNKEKLSQSLIKRIEMDAMPYLSKHIIYKEMATPHTLYRYTLNYRGAAYGWAAMPSQLAVTDFMKPSFANGLYLTGHWTTQGLGIPGVIYSGYDTAKLILRKERKIRYT